jgi:hypothetical protein
LDFTSFSDGQARLFAKLLDQAKQRLDASRASIPFQDKDFVDRVGSLSEQQVRDLGSVLALEWLNT